MQPLTNVFGDVLERKLVNSDTHTFLHNLIWLKILKYTYSIMSYLVQRLSPAISKATVTERF